jgi:hypothetical protein
MAAPTGHTINQASRDDMRRQTAPFLSALLAVGLAVMAIPAVDATPVFPPGLRVGLEPAADLKPARGFPGFADIERRAAVTILHLPPGAYDQVTRSAFAMPEHGFTEISREPFPFVDGLGFLIDGQTTKDGTDWHIWFLVARPVAGEARGLTALVRVEVPAAAREVYSDAVVRKMLASVTFRPEPVEERLGMLPFKLTDLAGLRVSNVLGNGTVVVTEGPSDNLADQPYAVVSIARGASDNPDDYARFARNLLASAPVRDLAVTSGDRMRINGLPGFEIRARGIDAKGTPLTLVQWLSFASGGGFVRVIAVAPRDDWDRMFNRFRTLRDGIELR